MSDYTLTTNTHLLAETPSAGAVHRSYVRVTTKLQPGSEPVVVALQFTETFSLAKNPDEHRVRFSMSFEDPETFSKFAEIINANLFV